MNVGIFAIRDIKVQAYTRIFWARTDGEATRLFSQLAADASSEVHRFPDDFGLWVVGSIDDYSGVVSTHEGGPKFLVLASAFGVGE